MSKTPITDDAWRRYTATEWTADQAIDVSRKLERENADLRTALYHLSHYAELYEPRTRTTEVQRLEHLRTAHALLVNTPDHQRRDT